MHLRNVVCILLSVIAGFSLITTETGCANMSPPTGGPRDSLPPMLVTTLPKDSSTGFNTQKIVINFDEYIQLDNIQKNLLVSPIPKIAPTVLSKLRTITITLRDTLEENTTYTLDFGNAVKDLNEGNVLRNFRYLFSTGNTLDSLEVAGKLIIAETGKTDSTMIVILHTNLDDSAVVKSPPRYAARVDRDGNFRFRNLPADTFAIYGLKDEGGSRRYLTKKQLFAFSDSLVLSAEQNRQINLYAFLAKDTATPKPSGLPPKKEPEKPEDKELRYQTNAAGAFDLLSHLEISFPMAPLQTFDTNKIRLTDTSFNTLPNYSFRTDSLNRKITLVHAWTENTPYRVLIDSTFATDTAGRVRPKSDTLAFQTKKNSEYGLVRLRFMRLPMEKNPVLLFVQSDNVKHTHVFTNNQFYAKLFPPGEYELRLVFDENRNGQWDTGEFFGERKQPEKVQLIDRKVNVKANWDTEVDIEL